MSEWRQTVKDFRDFAPGKGRKSLRNPEDLHPGKGGVSFSEKSCGHWNETWNQRDIRMASGVSTNWREVFENWPAGIAKRGVLVSTLNEITPFKSFLLKGDMLLLERTNPDPIGARFALMDFTTIHMVKIIEPLTEAALTDAGYVGHLAKM
jgi:hypothetical protein